MKTKNLLFKYPLHLVKAKKILRGGGGAGVNKALSKNFTVAPPPPLKLYTIGIFFGLFSAGVLVALRAESFIDRSYVAKTRQILFLRHYSEFY